MIYENAGAAGEKDRLRQRKGVQLMWFYRSSIGLLKIVEGSDENYYFQFGEDPTLWTAGYEDPEGLAEAIRDHVTGCPAWDGSDAVSTAELWRWQLSQLM